MMKKPPQPGQFEQRNYQGAGSLRPTSAQTPAPSPARPNATPPPATPSKKG